MVKFSKSVIVTRTYEVSAEEFVSHHLQEIRTYKDSKDKIEYDLFVSDGVNNGFLTYAFSIPAITFDINDYDRYASTSEEKAAHASACTQLVALISEKFKDKEKS